MRRRDIYSVLSGFCWAMGWLLAAVFLFYVGVAWILWERHREEYSTWVRVEAEVVAHVKAQPHEMPWDAPSGEYCVFRFTLPGSSSPCEVRSHGAAYPPAYQVGEKVELVCPPTAPQKATVATPSLQSSMSMVWLYIAGGLAVLAVALHLLARWFYRHSRAYQERESLRAAASRRL